MNSPLRILLVEDDPLDAELLATLLETEGLRPDIHRVQAKADLEAALACGAFDLVISDFTMPAFDGLSALALVRARRPDLPFIFFSGTIGEEAAVESLKHGATDYVLKQRPERLLPSVRRALREAEDRRQRRQAEEKYRHIFENAVEGICQTTPAGRFVTANPALASMLGYASPAELMVEVKDIGSQVYARPETRAELQQRVVQQGVVKGLECQARRKDGGLIWISINAQAVRDGQGSVTCYESTVEDITERKQAEAQRLRAQRMECLGALAGGIAHDLNNILAPVLMVAELLRDRVTNNDDFRMLDTLKSSAQRGADMVKQILSFARGTEGEPVALDLRRLIEEVAKLLRETFPRSITVETRISPGLGPVRGHPTQMHQVLMNLCVNARDAMPQGGTLRIAVENALLEGKRTATHPEPVSGPHVALTVSDTGTGMPASVLGRVFEPFFTTKGEGKGTGLGLPTVLGIVAGHGGLLEIDSREGLGTAFQVWLPVARKFEPVQAAGRSGPPRMGQGELVLVVDDEAAILEMARMTLETFNYRVLTARDGLQGFALYQQHRDRIGAVVTDLMMPNLNGAAMTRLLRGLDPGLRIVCASGVDSRARVAEINELGIQAFLNKPYLSGQLLDTLAEVLQKGTRP